MSPTVTGDFKNAVLYIGIFFCNASLYNSFHRAVLLVDFVMAVQIVPKCGALKRTCS